MLTTSGGRENTGPPHTRLTHGLIVGEVALGLILVVGASLFVQSFRNALLAEGGFDTSRILLRPQGDNRIHLPRPARRQPGCREPHKHNGRRRTAEDSGIAR